MKAVKRYNISNHVRTGRIPSECGLRCGYRFYRAVFPPGINFRHAELDSASLYPEKITAKAADIQPIFNTFA